MTRTKQAGWWPAASDKHSEHLTDGNRCFARHVRRGGEVRLALSAWVFSYRRVDVCDIQSPIGDSPATIGARATS